jgi:hypothetical protein
MGVNVKKCATARYRIDGLAEKLRFKRQGILSVTLAQLMQYLRTTAAARPRVNLEAMTAKLTEAKIRMKKIMELPLLIVQKIDLIKTFILPTLDS